jgi:hypothetical protein
MTDELARLKAQIAEDRKLFKRAAETLAEIDRTQGLDDRQADVLAALRIRVEGKQRASLEDLLSAAGEVKGKRDLGDVLDDGGDSSTRDWPSAEENRKDWPGL